MKLDRNENSDGSGKYALVNLRKVRALPTEGDTQTLMARAAVRAALNTLEDAGVLEYGNVGSPDEFFPIKLRDINAEHALLAYAEAARYNGDEEFANEVVDLALRSGCMHPLCKHPD